MLWISVLTQAYEASEAYADAENQEVSEAYINAENAPAQNALPPPRMQSTRPECNFIKEFVLNPGHTFHPEVLHT